MIHIGSTPRKTISNSYHPKTHVVKTDYGYTFMIHVPKFHNGDFMLSHQEGLLSIHGEHSSTVLHDAGKEERPGPMTSFDHTLFFPDELNPDSINAVYLNDMLVINVCEFGKSLPMNVFIA